ncbi:MAG: SpoVA/SpoVAEb family sporulation membrane protein [Clostridiales bacterium]|nr:SpoVA/SpoVAEb family sporulation membrane protein [Clostridiales bacterium]
MQYIWVFIIGGFVCAIGELLIITTNITSARILVTFVLVGVVLEAVGLFDYISDFAKAGINVPIIGFGASLAKGAIGAVKSFGLLGAFTGGLTATAGGIAAAVGFAFLFALIFSSHTKK